MKDGDSISAIAATFCHFCKNSRASNCMVMSLGCAPATAAKPAFANKFTVVQSCDFAVVFAVKMLATSFAFARH